MSKAPSSVLSGLGSRQTESVKHTKEIDRPKLDRYPKPLREMLNKRIATLERWLKFNDLDMSWKEALDDFRENVHMGVTSPFYAMKYKDCGDIVQSAWLLDEAFGKLHDYQPEDYLTEGVLKASQRFNRKGKTTDDTPKAMALLQKYGILNAKRGNDETPGTQGWIRKKVGLETSLSPRTIDGIASKLRKAAKLQKGIATN
ncbi:MAG: hypothetical protein FGM44_04730 [Limnohabitans sp.]|nr:hypothetical protein [Limnohabitans sp.]